MRTLAATMLVITLVAFAVTRADSDQAREQMLQRAIDLVESKGDLAAATPLLEETAKSADRALAARGLLYLAQTQERYGKSEALASYQRIVDNFGGPKGPEAARATVALAQTRLAQRSPQVVARQLWDQSGGTDSAAISPDGRYVSYSNDTGGDLAVHDVAKGTDRVLTQCGFSNECFVEVTLPSPDSRAIAYGWNTNEEKFELHVISASGGQPRIVYPAHDGVDYVYPHGWSPDSKSILATLETDRAMDLVWLPAGGGATRLVKHFDNLEAKSIRLSPDGRFVAYDRPTAPGKPERDVWSLSLENGREAPMLSRHAADDGMLAWFPAGDRVLFVSDRGGTYGIWSSRVVDGRAEGDPVLVRPDTGRVGSLGFTRKGDFYYCFENLKSEISVATLDPATSHQTGLPARLEGRYSSGLSAAAWSPTGDRIAYLQATTPVSTLSDPTTRGGAALNKKLAIQTVATGEVTSLTLPMRNVENPLWLPDGRNLIVQGSDVGGRQGLFRVNIETSAVTAIADRDPGSKEPNRTRPALSPDGQRIFFLRAPGPNRRIALQAMDLSSRVEQLVTTEEAILSVQPSPDGRWIALTRNTLNHVQGVRLFVIPSSGGDARSLAATTNDWSVSTAVVWSPDSGSVLVARRDRAAGGMPAPEIWQIPLNGSEPRRTGITGSGEITRMSLHPDGRRLAISAEVRTNETWVLQNLPAQSK